MSPCESRVIIARGFALINNCDPTKIVKQKHCTDYLLIPNLCNDYLSTRRGSCIIITYDGFFAINCLSNDESLMSLIITYVDLFHTKVQSASSDYFLNVVQKEMT